ncbi:MAG: VWA domain-containing protein [Dehalococcoidia bacterium]|nr:VWA domain-containing protein [Dehalococcoidia bacterium]MCB9484862.1 VWA domain-containing protein [Thermoflexaceae bacterium]
MIRSLLRHIRQDGDTGQALVIFAAGLILFLGFVGMSVDVGRYMWARGQMQSAVDAAALAAAQSMPNGTTEATTYANQYWDANNDFIVSQGENVSFNVTFPGGNKAVKIQGDADIPTWFVKLFGVDHWSVSASATAASQVLDIAVVLDVSGSMCFTSYPPVEGDGPNWTGYVMSPGRLSPSGGYAFPKLTQPISAGGSNSITISLNDIDIFTSTSSTNNRNNFGSGYNSSTPYWQRSPGGGVRTGMIMIDDEIFKITAVNTSQNKLTVTRAQTNNRTSPGTTTTKQAHSVGAEVWANRGSYGSQGYCDKAAYYARTSSQEGPHQPFDGALDNAKYFISLFNPAFDKMGVASYSSTADIHANLTGGSFSSLNSAINGFGYPEGGTNIAHGIARGMSILDGTGKRANSVRILVLLSDGVPNTYCTNGYSSSSCSTGSSNTPATCPASSTTAISHATARAAAAAASDVIVYTIGLGDGVLDCVMEDIAAAGGGEYYKAPTTAQLDEAFDAIAKKTHIGLTG